MSAVRYVVERGRLVVKARSSLHDTTTVWTRVTGTAEADPTAPLGSAPLALALAVDMTDFDAGDFLKNRKLRKDLEVERHPTARFELGGIERVVESAGGGFEAIARGRLAWRGAAIEVQAGGKGQLDAASFRATAAFELDVTTLGITPPRFLMFKVDDVVAVELELVGRART